ncbi:uncharacterized protein B0T15DRAFT_520319 [Chaetomium strumarium]|uniref:Uncharacterized protein n=1 Tax=Chaetomium strumarium TaxID=1170767 RepID=A0AAJ0H3D9_9PEZI|nr:hypothetical protein B0T15DRAFT_520319 [Chaetomium strumarium]
MLEGGAHSLSRPASYFPSVLASCVDAEWAVRPLVRAGAKGNSGMHSWRMAPFLHDDDRRYNGRTQSLRQISIKPGRGAAASHIDPGLLLKPHSATAETDCAENISVALEWKLLLPLLAPRQKDPRPDDGRPIVELRDDDGDARGYLEQASESIAQTVRRAGERAVTMHSLVNDGLAEKDFWDSSWVVKKANSVEPLDEEKAFREYIWVGVEICSPKMRFKDPDTQARILKVLAALNSGHRLAANCTCEVHVHLGRMDGRPWSLSTLKRLAALLWVAEPTLRSIRNPQSPNYHNIYTWGFPMRQQSRLAGRVGSRATTATQLASISDLQAIDAVQRQTTVPAQELNALVEIWKTSSHLELGQLLSGPEKMYRRLGFNFSAFGEEDERARRNPRTMEFRIMEGSISADLVAGWLSICGSIAETAVTVSDDRFTSALAVSLRHSDKRRRADEASDSEKETPSSRRGRDFRELMQALGVTEQHYRHFEEKIKREHRRF